MKAFQLLHRRCAGQRWWINDLNLFDVVDEKVEAGLATAAHIAHPVGRAHRPDHRNPPAEDRATEDNIGDEDDPTVRVVASECHDARRDVDDADNEEKYAQENEVVGMGICLHVTPPAK